MRLITDCKNCGEKIEFNEFVSDRAELNFEIGKNIELSCKKCFSKRIYHPNEIIAKKRKTVMIIGLLILIGGMILIMTFFWKFYNEHRDYLENENNITLIKKIIAMIVIPYILYELIMTVEKKKIKRFNSYKIKD
jgi:hypothetical protein